MPDEDDGGVERQAKKFHGPIEYSMIFMKKADLIKDRKLFTHDQALERLHRYKRGNKNIAVNTNYPWVYTSLKEIHSSVENYKFIVIPQHMEMNQLSNKFREIISYDKNAFMIELLKNLHTLKWLDGGTRLKKFRDTLTFYIQKLLRQKKNVPMQRNLRYARYGENMLLRNLIDAKGRYMNNSVQSFVNIAMRCNQTDIVLKIYNFFLNEMRIQTNCSIDRKRHACELNKLIKYDVFSGKVARGCKNKAEYHCFVPVSKLGRRIFKQLPCRECFKGRNGLQQWIQKCVDTNVHSLHKMFSTFKVGNTGVDFQKLFQGKESLIRDNISPKIKAIRCQISALAQLKPNQCVLPISKSKLFNLSEDIRLLDLDRDLHDNGELDQRCFMKLNVRIIMKRDPAINAASVSAHDEVAFMQSDLILVGLADLMGKNADFDGDTESVFIVVDQVAIDEIDMNVLPQNSLRVYKQLRIQFTESHILFMHQRQFDDNAFKFAREYNMIRRHETHKWWTDNCNITVLEDLEKRYPQYRFRDYVEPTKKILETVLAYIVQVHSDMDGYDFYNFINGEILKLAAKRTDTPLYDPKLPQFDYTMGNDLFCETILKTAFSEAKGSIETLREFASRQYSNDNTLRITPDFKPVQNRTDAINKIEEATFSMANKAKEVPKIGHLYFLNNIGSDKLEFARNRPHYGTKQLDEIKQTEFFNLLISPVVAQLLLSP